MKIERITFGKTIAMPGYNNDKPEIEATLEDGDTLESVLSALNKRLTDWHKVEYPHLYQEGPVEAQPFVRSNYQSPEKELKIEYINTDTIADTLTEIQNAPTLEILKTFKVIASSDPSKVLYNAYCERLKELSK